MNKIPALFVIGRFRSGTTLIWNILRHTGKTCAYYEPFNDNLLEHINADTKPMLSHVGVDAYWDAYQDIRNEIPNKFDRRFGIIRLCLGKNDNYKEMQAYIDWLISSCKKESLPVLQFNRADFRIPWLKSKFPDVPVLYVYRDPREQWMSIVKDQPEEMQKSRLLNTGYDLLIWSANLLPFIPDIVINHIRHSYDRHYILWKISYELGMQYADTTISLDDELHKDKENGVKKILKTANIKINPDKYISLISNKKNYKIDEKMQAWFEESESYCNQLLDQSGLLNIIKKGKVFDKESVVSPELSNIVSNIIYPVCHEISMHRMNAILASVEVKRILENREHHDEDAYIAALAGSVKNAEEYARSLELSIVQKDRDIKDERDARQKEHEEATIQISALDESSKQSRAYAESLKQEMDKVNQAYADECNFRKTENNEAEKQINALDRMLKVSEDYSLSLAQEREKLEKVLGELSEARDREQSDSILQIDALSKSMDEARIYTASLEKERKRVQDEHKNDQNKYLEKIASLERAVDEKDIGYESLAKEYEDYQDETKLKIKAISDEIENAEHKIHQLNTELNNLKEYQTNLESNRIMGLFIRLFRIDKAKS